MSDSLTLTVSREMTAIRARLRAAETDCRVYEEYAYRQAATLGADTLTVGVKAIRLADRYADGPPIPLQLNDTAEVDYEITAHCPVIEDGMRCRLMMTAAADALRTDASLELIGLTAGNVIYDRSRRCLCCSLIVTARHRIQI